MREDLTASPVPRAKTAASATDPQSPGPAAPRPSSLFAGPQGKDIVDRLPLGPRSLASLAAVYPHTVLPSAAARGGPAGSMTTVAAALPQPTMAWVAPWGRTTADAPRIACARWHQALEVAAAAGQWEEFGLAPQQLPRAQAAFSSHEQWGRFLLRLINWHPDAGRRPFMDAACAAYVTYLFATLSSLLRRGCQRAAKDVRDIDRLETAFAALAGLGREWQLDPPGRLALHFRKYFAHPLMQVQLVRQVSALTRYSTPDAALMGACCMGALTLQARFWDGLALDALDSGLAGLQASNGHFCDLLRRFLPTLIDHDAFWHDLRPAAGKLPAATLVQAEERCAKIFRLFVLTPDLPQLWRQALKAMAQRHVDDGTWAHALCAHLVEYDARRASVVGLYPQDAAVFSLLADLAQQHSSPGLVQAAARFLRHSDRCPAGLAAATLGRVGRRADLDLASFAAVCGSLVALMARPREQEGAIGQLLALAAELEQGYRVEEALAALRRSLRPTQRKLLLVHLKRCLEQGARLRPANHARLVGLLLEHAALQSGESWVEPCVAALTAREDLEEAHAGVALRRLGQQTHWLSRSAIGAVLRRLESGACPRQKTLLRAYAREYA